MSGGAALVALRTRRTTFAVLAIASVIAFFAVGSFASRALDQAQADAATTAKALASAGVASVLEPEDVQTAIAGSTGDDLLDRLQRGVLADGTVFRIRVWSPDGELLFSTDAADTGEELGDLPAIGTATKGQGRPTSRVVDGEVFETYVPLRLGQDDALGAVQIDQGYTPIAEKAASPWGLLRTLTVAFAGVFLALVIVATLPIGVSRTGGFSSPPASRKRSIGKTRSSRKGRSVAKGHPPEEVATVLVDDRSTADREALEAQVDQLRAQIASSDENAGRRIGELEAQLERAREREEEARVLAAEAAKQSASATADPDELEVLRAELAEVQARADQGARLADTADQTLLGFEARVQELESALATARSHGAEATAKLEAMQAELDLARSEADEAPADAERLAEAEEISARASVRVADAEALAQQAQARAEEAEAQIRELEERARGAEEAERRAHEAEVRAQEAGDRADRSEAVDANASALIAQLERQLLDERGRTAQLGSELERVAAGSGSSSPERDARRAADRDVELTAAQIRATEAERAARAARDRADEAERLAAEAEIRVSEAETLSATAAEAIAAAEGHAEDVRVAAEGRAGEMQAELDRTHEQVAALQGQVETIAAEGADRLGEMESTFAMERSQMEAALEAANADGAASSDRVDGLQEELVLARAESADALEVAAGLREELAKEAERSEELVEQVRTEARAALEQVRADADAAEEAVRSQSQTYLDTALEQAAAEARAREAELDAAHAEALARATADANAAIEGSRSASTAETQEVIERVRAEARERLSSLEAELAEADAREQAFEAKLAEHRAEVEASHAAVATAEASAAEAAALADQARAELAEATAIVEATETSVADEPARGSSGGAEVDELQRTVVDLESQLEQMSERLRHAYAQAESVQAAYSTARKAGEVPAADPEVRSLSAEVERLRKQLGESIASQADAEERAARFQADLIASQKGVPLDQARPEPGYEPPAEPSMRDHDREPSAIDDGEAPEEEPVDVEPERELSLRSRLANTAARKKQRGRPPDDGASGF